MFLLLAGGIDGAPPCAGSQAQEGGQIFPTITQFRSCKFRFAALGASCGLEAGGRALSWLGAGSEPCPSPTGEMGWGERTVSEPLFPGEDTYLSQAYGFSGYDQLATADSPGVALFLNIGSCC